MPKGTYITTRDSQGRITYTTYKVWTDSIPKTKTFKSLDEARSWSLKNKGVRLDKIVITIIDDVD